MNITCESAMGRVVFALLAFIAAGPVEKSNAADPATRPVDKRAATRPVPLDPVAAVLMDALGDPDPAVRTQAGDHLLAMGATSLTALGRAARSNVPEVRFRARALLQRFQWAESDDPPAIRGLMSGFGAMPIEGRRQVVRQLAATEGANFKPAWRAIGRVLLNDPADDVLWEAITQTRTHPQLPQTQNPGMHCL